ncbi:ATP-binding protein [Nonomuraea sp. NPDC049784]|jgi:anti-sigma regulatory factor (Ser/Thr protein kinase)|uniref:ATP-binding protein n=1 Tax=Nonomuraea sp. NPDC049784 TaxID=3154361 RepID=UPI0033C682B0
MRSGGTAPTRLRRATLHQDPYAPQHARLAVRTWLGTTHPALYDIELVVSELVTNAVKHALKGPDRDWVRLRLDEDASCVRLVVTDPGNPGSEPQCRPLPADWNDWIPRMKQPGGMGLATITAICDGAWGTYLTEREERVVWCCVPL